MVPQVDESSVSPETCVFEAHQDRSEDLIGAFVVVPVLSSEEELYVAGNSLFILWGHQKMIHQLLSPCQRIPRGVISSLCSTGGVEDREG